jgi:hypothetical protein
MSVRIRVAAAHERSLDGHTFDSRAEMQRYAELKMLERAGIIRDLQLQPEFILQAPFIHEGKKIQAIKYFADFAYLDLRTNRNIVEDCKGMKTEVYRLKKKMLHFKYPNLNFIESKA